MPKGTEEKLSKPQLGQPVSKPRFESSTTWIKATRFTTWSSLPSEFNNEIYPLAWKVSTIRFLNKITMVRNHCSYHVHEWKKLPTTAHDIVMVTFSASTWARSLRIAPSILFLDVLHVGRSLYTAALQFTLRVGVTTQPASWIKFSAVELLMLESSAAWETCHIRMPIFFKNILKISHPAVLFLQWQDELGYIHKINFCLIFPLTLIYFIISAKCCCNVEVKLKFCSPSFIVMNRTFPPSRRTSCLLHKKTEYLGFFSLSHASHSKNNTISHLTG